MNQKVEAVTIGLALHDLCIEFMASSLRIYGSTKEIFLWQLVYSTYLTYVQLFKTSLFLRYNYIFVQLIFSYENKLSQASIIQTQIEWD